MLQASISGQACYVISEYFPSPQQVVAEHTQIPRQQVLQLALQLAKMLDQLHKAGLVRGGIDHSALDFRAPDRDGASRSVARSRQPLTTGLESMAARSQSGLG
jgi:hypothetical protein